MEGGRWQLSWERVHHRAVQAVPLPPTALVLLLELASLVQSVVCVLCRAWLTAQVGPQEAMAWFVGSSRRGVPMPCGRGGPRSRCPGCSRLRSLWFSEGALPPLTGGCCAEQTRSPAGEVAVGWGGQPGLAPLSSRRPGYCCCCLTATCEPISMFPLRTAGARQHLLVWFQATVHSGAADGGEEGVRSVADGWQW